MSSTKAAPCCSAFDFSFFRTAISNSVPMDLAEMGCDDGLPGVGILMLLVSADLWDFLS